jgi:hypothetical protein
MQEQAASPFYDFMYPKYLLRDLYDIEMQPDDYLERAYNVFRSIGNIATGIYTFKFTVPQSGIVELPCNVEFIEAVSSNEGNSITGAEGDFTLLYSDSNISPNGYLADVVNDPTYTRVPLPQNSELHPLGSYMPYNLIGDKGGNKSLQFTEELIGFSGTCIYRGICVDDDNNPLLYRKEAEAIAAQLAFIDTQKKLFMRDPGAASILPYIKQEAGRLMAAAKIPEYITQNQWNRVFSAMTTHNRKVFNSSYKPLQ